MELPAGMLFFIFALSGFQFVSAQQMSLNTQSLIRLLRQERPAPRNQSRGLMGSPSDTVYTPIKHANQRPSPRLGRFAFAEYRAYDGPSDQFNEYPSQSHKQSYNGGQVEIGVEVDYEPYGREYGRPFVEIHRSTYPSGHGYDAYASPYHRTPDVSYYPPYTAHYFTPRYQNYRMDHEDPYEHGPYGNRLPMRSGFNNLFLGLYDSPNTIPYNVQDYKKYPYGYSRGFSGAKSYAADYDEASMQHPVSFRPRLGTRKHMERKRPNPGLTFDREPLETKPSVMTFQPISTQPVNQPFNMLPQLLRSYFGGGGEGSYERSEGYEAEKLRKHFLPYLTNGIRF